MNYHQQLGANDCGPACLAMVASHYGSYISIGDARKLCKTDAMGANLAGLVAAAEKLGFDAKALKGERAEKTLDEKLLFPFIAHIKTTYLDRKYDHFVVIKSISKTSVEIWDPNPAEGRHKVSRAEFLTVWSGYALFLSPNSRFTPKKEKGNVLFKYAPLLLPHKKSLAVICMASCLLIVFGVTTSFYYKYIIDEVVITKAEFTLASLSIGVLLIAVIQSFVEMSRGILINHVVYKADLQLTFSYIGHVLKLPVSFFDSRRTGEILSRLDDIAKIQGALSGTALSLVMDAALLLVIGPLLFSINEVLFSISVASVLLVGVIMYIFSTVYRKYYALLRHQEAGVSSTLVEIVSGVYTIKALNAEMAARNDYEKSQMAAVWTSWKASNLRILQGFLTGIVNGVTGIVIFWAGSSGIIKDAFSFGTLISFNALLAYFTGPLFRMVNLQSSLQEAFVAAERVSEILEMEREQPEGSRLLKSDFLEGEMAFSHVRFKYGMRPLVYQDLSFHIKKGQWAAFVGASGCGKTTLVKLLLKFYEPESGSVFIDGHDVRDMDAVSLRARIGYVPQDVYMFSGTIAENIALREPSASLEDVMEAAKKAGADEFINKLPERYNAKAGERGATLSGGERQRLALARALLGNPDLMILDEATSNLDSASERLIHQTIEKLRGDMTVVMIAHRLTTVQKCDVIFVIDKGAIIESGSHEALLAQNGAYKRLWENTEV
jgi:ATP-binding cassette subfamily B protein